MERLTKRIGNTVDFANGRANLKDHKANVKLLFKRLAEYEDTRLIPKEIEDLKRKYQEDEHEFCGQYGTDDCQFQYRLEKIKQERDYWKKEALKWAAERLDMELAKEVEERWNND